MSETKKSPKVAGLAWGSVDIDGLGKFKDVKLYPGGARSWDWGETGTEHSPGIQLADVEELLEHGAQTVILTQGVLGRLQIAPDTTAGLEKRGAAVHILKTNEAVKLYNQLAEDQPVGMLLHSTC